MSSIRGSLDIIQGQEEVWSQTLYLFQFQLEENDGVLKESAKDKDDASNHPTLYSCQAFSLMMIYDNDVVDAYNMVMLVMMINNFSGSDFQTNKLFRLNLLKVMH